MSSHAGAGGETAARVLKGANSHDPVLGDGYGGRKAEFRVYDQQPVVDALSGGERAFRRCREDLLDARERVVAELELGDLTGEDLHYPERVAGQDDPVGVGQAHAG